MQYSEHKDGFLGQVKVDSVRKGMQQRSPHVAGHGGKLSWACADAHDCSIDIAEEPCREPGALLLVPPRGILEIGLGEWPNDEPAGHAIQWLVSSFLRSRS
jgi:hypothetical protein